MLAQQRGQQQQQSTDLQFAYDSQSNEIVKVLVCELNKLRRQSRHPRLYRSKLGDCVAVSLHDRGIKTTDQCYSQAVQELGLMSLDSEFITFEQKISRGTSMCRNIQENFMEIFIDKAKQSFKSKLVTSNVYTHISMAVKQSGISSDVFQIGVLLFKANVTIEKVFESCNNEGALIVGKVLDHGLKPCMAVLNRDQGRDMCVVGPNKIYFDASDGDDYKVHVPEGYLRKNRHPILGVNQPLIEIYCTLSSNRDCQLANTMDIYAAQTDIDQKTEPLQLIGQGIELGLRTFMMPTEDFKGLSMKIEEAISPQTNLLKDAVAGGAQNGSSRATGRVPASLHNRLANNANRNRQPMTSTTGVVAANQPPQIRKTNAQIKREQLAAMKKAQPPAAMNETAGFGPSNVNQFHQQNKPRNALNSTFAPTPISNFTPSQRHSHTGVDQVQSAMNRVSLTPGRQSQAPQFNWNKSSGVQQKPHFQFPKTATTSTTTMINTMATKQPAYQPAVQIQQPSQPSFQNFANPFQANKQIPQFQTQPPNATYQFNQTVSTGAKPGSFLTSAGINQGTFPSQNRFAQQPTNAIQTLWKTSTVVQAGPSTSTQHVEMQGPEPLANFNPTPLPVRYAVNGTQSKRFDSKRSHQDTGLLPIQTQQEILQAQMEFAQLSEGDQHYLQNCLRELADFGGDVEELKGAEMLMLSNPISFYQMYQSAIAVVKSHEKAAKCQGSKEKPTEKEDKPMITVQDFGEIHLFLINFAEKLMSCSKYIDKPKSTKAVLQAVTDIENETTATQGLLEIILGSPLPRNDSLVKMYGSKTVPHDLVFLLRDQKLKCHQFVFQQNSQFMREAMRKNQQMNVQQFGQQMSTMTFNLPDWMDLSALQNYVRFSYTTEFKMTQTSQSAKRKDRPHEALELFRVACYFYCSSLQECLAAREIIPNMNAYSAILFLTELFQRETKSPCKRESSERVTSFLSDFCMFYLAKNLPVILRQEQQSLLGLPQTTLYELIKESLYYIVDGRADIEIVLTYGAKIFTEGDIFKLFQLVHQRMTKCCGFDQQHVPQMSQIADIDPSTVYSLEIIEGFNYDSLMHEKKKVRDSFALGEGTADQDAQTKPSTFQANRKEADVSFSSAPNRGPSENVLLFQDGQADTQAIIDPDFELIVDLTEAETAVHLGKDKPGLTLISQAFDVARRSWSLKVDIAKPSGEISLWLVERGAPQNEINALQVLRRALPIKFTSQFFEMEIDDPGVKNRKSVIFYSFCHGQHQVIGHENFANLDQLANKDKIKIRVKVREHVIHSAMVQQLATTFQRRFKEECALEQTRKMCPMTVKEESYGLFSQPTYVAYWILSSDLLKVEDENTVLSFIFHYTDILRERKGQIEAILAADQLAKSLRFNYVDFYNLMSAIRKNPTLQASPIVNDSFVREQGERLKLNKKGISKMLASFVPRQDEAKPVSELHFCGVLRKYYNLQKIEGQARQKLLTCSKDVSLAIAEEFIQWAFHSKIQEIDTAQSKLTPYQLQYQVSEQVQNANRNINNQLVEERIRANRLANELYEMKRKYESEINKQRGDGGHQVYQPSMAPKFVPPVRHESPPKYVPRSLAGLHLQPEVKENVPPPKLSLHQQAAKPTPLYIQPRPEQPAATFKRDPPGGLMGGVAPVQRRQPPSSLMNKSLGNRTFNSENLLQNSFAKDNDLTKPKGVSNNLNLSNFTNPNTKRQPPASLAGGVGGGATGGNLSMDLSAVMNKLNESPAPTLRRRPTKANANANAYLASKNGGGAKGENCAIF